MYASILLHKYWCYDGGATLVCGGRCCYFGAAAAVVLLLLPRLLRLLQRFHAPKC